MKRTIRISRLAAILFIGAIIPAASHAQGVLYDWTATSIANSAYSGQGTMIIDSSDFTVTQITGTINGNAINSLYTGPGLTYDNICNTTSPHLDSGGVAFLYHQNSFPLNYYGLYDLNYVSCQYVLNDVPYDNGIGQPFSDTKSPIATLDIFSITPAPEPAAFALFTIGSIAVILWRWQFKLRGSVANRRS